MGKDIPKIKTAIAQNGYKLELTFEDGVFGIIDLSKKVGKGFLNIGMTNKILKILKL